MTEVHKDFNPIQGVVLFILRISIGWHLLYEGIYKIINPNWSSLGFLKESKWILSGLTNWIISNPKILTIVDFLNSWGLIAIGIGLMLGLFTQVASAAGVILLLLYYSVTPPMIGLEYSILTEGNNLIVNKTFIESISLLLLNVFHSGKQFGLDLIINKYFKNKKEVYGSRK